MKRYILRILLCLFLGVVTTVGVAWWFAAISAEPGLNVRGVVQRQGEHENVDGDGYSYWLVIERRRIGSLLLRANWHDEDLTGGMAFGIPPTVQPESLVTAWAPQLSPLYKPSTSTYHEVIARANGWPLLSIAGVMVYEKYPDDATESYQFNCAMRIRNGAVTVNSNLYESYTHHWDQRLLPLRPLWPGFLIDTLFYGTIWFGLLFGIGATRGAIRRKRGRCPMCGYDLRGDFNTGCPECGWNRE